MLGLDPGPLALAATVAFFAAIVGGLSGFGVGLAHAHPRIMEAPVMAGGDQLPLARLGVSPRGCAIVAKAV